MVITQKITSLAFEIHDGKGSMAVSQAHGRRDRSDDGPVCLWGLKTDHMALFLSQ